jgi:hypothetical protein
MENGDLLYSGLMVTAVILSVWTGALLAAACVFVGQSFLSSHTNRISARKS